jgi:nucleotide-binding universal stress UspA family protein
MTAVEFITSELESPQDSARKKFSSIVVATDGSDTALPAFNAAAMLRAKTGADIHVLTVLEPIPPLFPAVEGMIIPPDVDRSREEGQRSIVTEQVKAHDPGHAWTIDMTVGRPAEVIAAFAHEQRADLIIIGANKHGVVGRILGEETSSEIARLCDTPLLVASAQMKRLPRRVVIAMALSPDGLEGAAHALHSLTDSPSISTVHVKPRSEFLGVDWAEFDDEYEIAMRERFHEFEKTLEAVNIRSDLVVLHGDRAREIADFAAYSKAELVVVGVKRRRGRRRAVGGRLAGRVMRSVSCSVLVLPGSSQVTTAGIAAGATHVVQDARMWSETLRDFTARNAGRTVNLEVDDPEVGALVEATAYPLLGVDYDHKDGRLTILLGLTKGMERHLSRTISHPERIAVLSKNGRDTALAVTHGGGQTLLTL